jgi:hypothetical protein
MQMRVLAERAATAALATIAATTALACSGPSVEGSGNQGRTYGTETWYEASVGSSATEVEVRFDGPAANGDEDCRPDREIAVEEKGGQVLLTVKRYAPSPVVECPTAPQTMKATLPAPLGDRALVNPQTGWTFRAEGGGAGARARLVLDPASTPCAREDCSTPAVAKASCDPLEYAAVVDEQLRPRRGQPDTEVRCDGSFLTMVRDGRRAWFVNREAAWKLVAVDPPTCEDVWKHHRIRFPEPLCR